VSEFEQIAVSWINLHHAELNSDEYIEEFWSFDKLSDFCRKRPHDSWKVIVEIYERNSGNKVISNLAAGPIEDLLVYHGNLALILIDQYCHEEHKFVEVMKLIWKNSMSDEVWGQLQRLIHNHS
jgi:hypothetical protein